MKPPSSCRVSVTPAAAAFTLTELLAVIAIVGVLAAILAVTVGKVRDASRSTQCLGNLRQIYTAASLYSADHKQMTPTRKYNFYPDVWPYAYPNRPYKVTWNNPPPEFAGTIFECPAVYDDPYTVKRSYGINLKMAKGYGNPDVGVPLSEIGTPARTVYFGDVKSDSSLSPAAAGGSNTCNGRHNGRMNAVFFDGHAEAVQLTPDITNPPNIYASPFWMSPTH